MADYDPPLSDMRFALRRVGGLEAVCGLPAYAEPGAAVADAVLDEAARFAREVLAPLNASGDRAGASLREGVVRAPPGYGEAYRRFAAAGWSGVSAPQAYGGQGLPRVLGLAVEEMWNGANLAFALAPMLTAGVVRTLALHGSPALQRRYLPPLVAGRWSGTMNLTEPQAGSDLSMLRALATPEGGAWRLRGTKAFITWGEHDMAENIVHLVLARTPDAPAGVRGISLFVVPRLIVDEDGTPGIRNDVTCVAIERKAGLHASPTCVLNYGEQQGALAFLVGEPGRGLEYMFTMMNQARLDVGLEGVAVAERSYQAARAYAASRIQGRDIAGASGDRVPILRHPDVRRMLLSMKCRVEAMRALTYYAGGCEDHACAHPDAHARARYQARVELLTPVIKGWCTEQAVDIAALGMQVHGGVGYVEDTGVAQLWRDARVTPIYEGTTGIQANDLLGRKLQGDGGTAAFALVADMRAQLEAAAREAPLHEAAVAGLRAVDELGEATRLVLATTAALGAAVAVPYLELFGTVAGAWMSVRAAAMAREDGAEPDVRLATAKLAAAKFYAAHVLPRACALARIVRHGGPAVLDCSDDDL